MYKCLYKLDSIKETVLLNFLLIFWIEPILLEEYVRRIQSFGKGTSKNRKIPNIPRPNLRFTNGVTKVCCVV